MLLRQIKPVFLLVSLGIVALDQWTKWLIEARLPLYAIDPILPGFLNLTHVQNTGVAFGLFAEQGAQGGSWLLILLGLVALVAIGAYLRFAPSLNPLLLTALSLVLGGAIGNLTDRVLQGSVTDFIQVYFRSYYWPSFNVADSAISIGIVLMIWDSFRNPAAGSASAASVEDERPGEEGSAIDRESLPSEASEASS